MFIEIQAVPLLEQIEQRDRESEPHLEICPNTLSKMFKSANLRQEREHRLDQHPVVPLAAPTKFEVFRLIRFAPKAGVRQNNHPLRNSFDERQKFLIRNVRRLYLPIGNESELVGQQAKFSADNPFPGSESFLADALSFGLMIFTNRMTKLDTVRIDDPENGLFRQKLFRQALMCFEATKKSGALRQRGKQVKPVLTYPSIKSVLRTAFQSKQQPQSDQFTQRKFGLNMLLYFRQHVIYAAKKFYDKVFLSHGYRVSLCFWFRHLHNRNFSVTFSTSTNG